MGIRRFDVPGGLPEYTGSENWGDASSSGGGDGAGLILSSDKTFYIDAADGDSSNTGESPAAAWDWFGPLRTTLEPYVRIDATIRVNVLGTQPAEFAALDLPAFGPHGKLVIVGEQTTAVANFVADPGSTELVLRFGGPVDDWAGMTIMCTVGNNAGYRRSVARVTFGDTNQIWPSERWPFDPVGDTFYISRPASTIDWPSAMDAPRLLRGGGGTVMPYAPANQQSGVWFSNIAIVGATAIGRGAVVNFVGVEVRDHGDEGTLHCVTAYDDAIVRAGICPTAAPWIGQALAESVWNGWGIQQPPESFLTTAGILPGDVEASIAGTICGRCVELRAGVADLVGGCLRGGMSLPALRTSGQAHVAITAVGMFSTAPHVIEAFDGSLVTLGGTSEYEVSSLPPTDPTSFESSTLLRASSGALISIFEGCGVIGTTFGLGQDASGGGTIRWNGPITINGEAADLASEGFRADNLVLEHAPSTFDGGFGVSRIERYGEASLRFGSLPQAWNAIDDACIAVFNGPEVELFPAPPAGYVRILSTIKFANRDLAATIPIAGMRLVDDDGLLFCNSAAAAAQGASSSSTPTLSSASAMMTDKAVRAQLIGGGAAGMVVHVLSFFLPKPSIYVVQKLTGTAFVPIAGVVPTEPGVAAVPWRTGITLSGTGSFSTGSQCSIEPSPPAQGVGVTTRYTRGGAAYEQTYGVIGGGTGRLQVQPQAALRQGDLLEIRITWPPQTIPDSTVIRMAFELVPIISA